MGEGGGRAAGEGEDEEGEDVAGGEGPASGGGNKAPGGGVAQVVHAMLPCQRVLLGR